MNSSMTNRVLICLAAALVLGGIVPQAAAQMGSSGNQAAAGRVVLADDLQRSARQYTFQLSDASGAKRGEEIYYFKCWTCHNQYTIKSGTPAPYLKDLLQRSTEEAVAEKIRDGSPLMPAYRHTLNDADVQDLISYIRDERCCFEGDDPPPNPWYRAKAQTSMPFQFRYNLRGGPQGKVRSSAGDPLEGIMVQLIAGENSIRTTVYSNEAGEYEFPKLPSGQYTLRIAKPLEFRPYRKNAVRIDGATPLQEIVLERVTEEEVLPPTPDIAGQLSGSEWLLNMAGTQEEKRLFVKNCNWCHSYQLVFRARYDEDGWGMIVDRMSHYAGSPLINRNSSGRMEPDQEKMLVAWLARVRGPDSKDTPFKTFPPAGGLGTRVIVTEYELPRLWLATHDVSGDSQGNLWYSPHRSPFIGKLDPRTGFVTEYHIPDTPGAHPGTHWIQATKDGKVWSSQNWAKRLTQLDPRTGEFHQIQPPMRPNDDGTPRPMNSPMGGNWVVAPDGMIWKARDNKVVKVDPETGKYLEEYPIKNVAGTYGSAVTADGNYFGGGGWGADWVVVLDIRTGEVIERKARTPNQGPGRGNFDPFNNYWSGGKGGALVRMDPRTRLLKEFFVPLEYVSFYEANSDRNGEIWAGGNQTGRYFRFNPKTERWITYVLPEPYAHNRKSWIDNSTTPVSLWYVDHNSYLVHIQPLE